MLCRINGFTTVDVFHDGLNRSTPDEGKRMFIVHLNVVFDRLNQFWHGVENATSNLLLGQLRKPALDQVEPRGTRRNEVQRLAAEAKPHRIRRTKLCPA